MATFKLEGSTSGEITVESPAVSGLNTISLPAKTGNLVINDGVSRINIPAGTSAQRPASQLKV